MEALESEVKALHVALEQVQAMLTSPELARQSLKEQLAQRQVTVVQMIRKQLEYVLCMFLLTFSHNVISSCFCSVFWQIWRASSSRCRQFSCVRVLCRSQRR